MTNEEARKILDTQWPAISYNQGAAGQNNYNGLAQMPNSYRPPLTPETFIKLAVALGMLRLDEPGAEDEKLETQVKLGGFMRQTEIAYIFSVLDELNLKIVDK